MTKRAKTTLGVVHVTATSPKMHLTMEILENMHRARGFSEVGYNIVIFRDGHYEVSPRGWDGIGAHVAGFNSISLGVSMEGGIDLDNRPNFGTITEAQLATLLTVMQMADDRYGRLAWCGHRDLSPDKNGDGIIEPYEWMKACPCFDVIPWAEERGFKGADIKGTWTVGPVMQHAHKIVYQGPDSRTAWLQRLLVRSGHPLGPVDGIIGGNTQAAIMAFQREHNLPTSGEFDLKTVATLRSLYE